MLPCFGRETSYQEKQKSFIATAPVPSKKDSWVHTIGDHISAPSSRPSSAIYGYVQNAVNFLYMALNPRHQDTFTNHAPEALHCERTITGIEPHAEPSGWPCQTFPGILCGNKKVDKKHIVNFGPQLKPALLRAFELVLSISWDI
jgi:hypothetical protein